MNLITAIRNSEKTVTENGAITPKSTNSPLLDFFSRGAAFRTRSETEINVAFDDAFAEDPAFATKCMFYFRDIRGGQGERRVFRTLLKHLAEKHTSILLENLSNVPVYGRWDDLFVLLDTKVKDSVLALIKEQLFMDCLSADDSISLLAKWLPGCNTSSKESRKQAQVIYNYLDWSPKIYRKTLSRLRAKLNVVERKMCGGDWKNINYETVPSRAAMVYRNAFVKRDRERYEEYLKLVGEGKRKINSATLYPYDIIANVRKGDKSKTLELQWSSLPNYLSDNPHNGIAVCDVSGSMCQPVGSASVSAMNVSISMSMYLAQRIQGKFNNHIITFSDEPSLVSIKGESLSEKVNFIEGIDWGGSTNIQAVFDLILNAGRENNIPQSEMPDVIYIFSDMEFNYACHENNKSNFEVIKEKYNMAGYRMPLLVFWNLCSRNNHSPVKQDEENVVLVSGFSPSLLKNFLSGKNVTPYDFMIEVLNDARYSLVTV